MAAGGYAKIFFYAKKKQFCSPLFRSPLDKCEKMGHNIEWKCFTLYAQYFQGDSVKKFHAGFVAFATETAAILLRKTSPNSPER